MKAWQHGGVLVRAVAGLLLLVASVGTLAQPATFATSPPPQSSPALPSAGPLDSLRSW